MVSELSAEGLGWLAAALGGCFLGTAAAFVVRALASRQKGLYRKSRSFVSFFLLSLSVVVAAGASLLVFPPKSLLPEAALWIWACGWALLGFLSALMPRWFGAPLAILVLTALGLGSMEASSWHLLRPGREVARFMPYEVTEDGASGDLSVPDRNAVPVLSKLKLESRDCILEARAVKLSGPLASAFGSMRYTLTYIRDEEGRELHRFPEKRGPLTAFMIAEGPRGPWIEIRTVRSKPLRVEELVSVAWLFSAEGDLETQSP